MTNPSAPNHRRPLSPQSAFVVHLATDAEAPDLLFGRVEHVTSGAAQRFASSAELVAFMRRTLAKTVKPAVLVLALLAAVAAGSGPAHALCCQPRVGACSEAPLALAACVLGGGTLELNDACTPVGCRPIPPTTGCCETSLLKCASASTANECSSRGGRFLTGHQCTFLGCLPLQTAPTATPTRTAIRTSTSSPTRTATASSTRANTATATASVTVTDTATESPTPTATWTPTTADTATATPVDTATATLTSTQTPTASDTATNSPTPTETPTSTPTFTPTPTATCGSEPPVIQVVINPGTDAEEQAIFPPLPPNLPPGVTCGSQTSSGGGCQLQSSLDGSADLFNVFDMSGSFDPRSCGQDPKALSYKWDIEFPPTLQGGFYASKGISGYLTDTLTILPSSLPALDSSTDAGGDPFWRARVTVTALTEPQTQTVLYFRFLYQETDLTLQMSTDCQLLGHLDGVTCTIENGLPTTEPR